MWNRLGDWIVDQTPWAWVRGALWTLAGLSMFCALLATVTYGEHGHVFHLIAGAVTLVLGLLVTRWAKKDHR